MTDTLWADVSEYQVAVNDSYPYRVLAFRSNDGTYRDRNCAANLAWAKAAVDSGRLDFFIVYLVYRPNWQATLATCQQMVGAPHDRMVVMIDVESWGGQISGDQSAGINALREGLIGWLGGNRDRVIGYGNRGDLDALWRTKGDAWLVVAAYGSNPTYNNKIAHQYTDAGPCAPFGTCDMNSADGMDVPSLMAAFGIGEDMPLTDADIAAVAKATAIAVAYYAENNEPWLITRVRGIDQKTGQLNGMPALVQGVTDLNTAVTAEGGIGDRLADVQATLTAAQSGLTALQAQIEALPAAGGISAEALADIKATVQGVLNQVSGTVALSVPTPAASS